MQQAKISNKQKKRKDKPPQLNMESFSEFKKSEKVFRAYKGGQTDFSQLIDFNNPNLDLEASGITKVEMADYRIYKLKFPSGVYVIKNFLNPEEQIEITKKCLNEYHKKPNRTNLFIYDNKENLAGMESIKKDDEMEEKKAEEPDKLNISSVSSSMLDDNSKDPYNKEKFLINDPKRYYFNKKIRWANVGYQYDWDKRMYPDSKSPLPETLDKLCEKTKLFVESKLEEEISYYKPESTIINYYDVRNYMGGHLDDGEKDQKSPIFSYCFGLSCVFLMGGKTKDIKPLALKLDSGDMIIMSGYSRNCYHGVPRIIEGSFNPTPFEQLLKNGEDKIKQEISKISDSYSGEEFENNDYHAFNYLKENRLNVNFRQVIG